MTNKLSINCNVESFGGDISMIFRLLKLFGDDINWRI